MAEEDYLKKLTNPGWDYTTVQQLEPQDFTEKYNTQLTPEEEAAFQAWGVGQGGRNPAQDTYDYDMRGFWKSNGQFADNGHAGDQYKKPNHPSFSDQSQYNGVDSYIGGHWTAQPNGSWEYLASPTNLQMTKDLQSYFKQQEQGTVLRLPGSNDFVTDQKKAW